MPQQNEGPRTPSKEIDDSLPEAFEKPHTSDGESSHPDTHKPEQKSIPARTPERWWLRKRLTQE